MTKHILLSLSASLLLAFASTAQERCGSMDILAREIAADPARGVRLQEIDNFTNDLIAHDPDAGRGGGVITIPVIFHVLYNLPIENIPTSQILSFLDQMNADFGRTNADAVNTPAPFLGVASSTGVQFCLAQRDPQGNPTNGIKRKFTNVTSFTASGIEAAKFSYAGGDNAWPRDSYLNIWVCNLQGTDGGLLGTGTFPGGPANKDGLMIRYTLVGSLASPGNDPTYGTRYGLGRIAAHEIGHWLNLRHITGDAVCGNDQVADTYTQEALHDGCIVFPAISPNPCFVNPDGDMFNDYMDYTDDACQNMFTAGQAARMNALFAPGGARAALLTSLGCSPVTPACPATALVSTVGSTFSCGATGKIVGASGNAGKIFAQGVSRIFNQAAVQANQYQFEISNPGAGYLRNITSTSAALVLAKWSTNPLLCGTFVYNVRVRASFDGGLTYCPFGSVCTVSITNNFASPFCTPPGVGMVQNEERALGEGSDLFSLWPNPNSGSELFLSMNGMDENATSMSVDMFDVYGKHVMTSTIPAVDGSIKTTIKLNGELASGLYFVNVTCAGEVRSERLMIQR